MHPTNRFAATVYSSFSDQRLVQGWKELESLANPFPQCSYSWCLAWWELFSEGRSLAIVTVECDNSIVCVCPLCIESVCGVKILRTIPIDFGDFFSVTTSPYFDYDKVILFLLSFIESKFSYAWIRFDRISSTDPLHRAIANRKYSSSILAENLVIDFPGSDWDTYFLKLRRKFRQEVRRRTKRLTENFQFTTVLYTDWNQIEPLFSELQDVYALRWASDYSPMRSSRELDCWRVALGHVSSVGQLGLFVMYIEESIAAYRLGFFHDNYFYDWHVSFNPIYKRFHVGVIHLSIVMKYLISHGYKGVNFMASVYDWKFDWSFNHQANSISTFTGQSPNLIHMALSFFLHKLKPMLKSFFHYLFRYQFFRMLSRSIRKR